jgi:UDP-N-acetylmuramoylalanine--D-glutamate ligase
MMVSKDRGGLSPDGSSILVVGGANTGVSTARFLSRLGARVTLTDMATLSGRGREIEGLRDLGVSLELGGHTLQTFLDADLIVVSPGVPLYIEPLVMAAKKGVRIIGELELAFRYLSAPVIAITGTNGKTTTTALLGDILAACGMRVLVGGNIGTPLIEFAADDAHGADAVDFIVAEISSFQLEAVETFRPRVSLLLNITPDHLDRYRSYQEYIDAKCAIFANQTADDTAVLNRDDELVTAHSRDIAPKKLYFSRKREEARGVWYNGKNVVCNIGGERNEYDPADSPLVGVHNIENIMAAVTAAAAVGCAGDAVQRAIREFTPHGHRLQHVLTTPSGVSVYDDSKATNVGAAIKSIESFKGNLHIIMGGVDKGGSYAPLIPLLKERASAVYLIGEAAPIIERELSGVVPLVLAGDMENAVKEAKKRVGPGDVLLLAPACSSFDQYRNYQERGDDFANHVARYFGHGR